MARLDDELDELTDKALDKLMARTEDLDRLADLLLERGLAGVLLIRMKPMYLIGYFSVDMGLCKRGGGHPDGNMAIFGMYMTIKNSIFFGFPPLDLFERFMSDKEKDLWINFGEVRYKLEAFLAKLMLIKRKGFIPPVTHPVHTFPAS